MSRQYLTALLFCFVVAIVIDVVVVLGIINEISELVDNPAEPNKIYHACVCMLLCSVSIAFSLPVYVISAIVMSK